MQRNLNGNDLHAATRREFLRTSGVAMTAAASASLARTAVAADGGETLKVGLIGCGGRGTGAVRQAIMADPNTKLVALGDAFKDQAESALKKLKAPGSGIEDRVDVTPDHIFSDFDNYQGVIDACDVVVLAAPPAFRPKHLKAAVEGGCHIFCEKPIAVDAPGVRSVMETSKRAAEKDLNLVSGLCYRYQFAKQATLEKLHSGIIGDITAMQTTYNTGGLWHKGRKDSWSDMEYQMRNWLYFDWLSGDHINEQHIHSLDKIIWAMNNEAPVKATASGGRIVRTDPKYGNIYDHFNTVYEWKNGVRCFSSCRQWESTSTDVSDWIFGTKGVANIQEHKIEPTGGDVWKHKPDGPDDMYQNEHNALFAAIRSGDTINNGDYMCTSTMTAIMGRMSAYTGQTLSWKKALNSETELVPKQLAWSDHEVNPVAQPGVTKFA